MTNPRKALIVSFILFWVAVLILVEVIIFASANAKPALDALQQAQTAEQTENPVVPITPQDGPENKATDTSSRTSSPATVKDEAAAPQSAIGGEAPEPQRIPFTQNEVTPGDPQSYVGTYGQCPFYENAMEGKGCVPPADLECNADWTECHPRQQ